MMKSESESREKVTILSPKDMKVSYFCGSGAGGQARNKVASGVMIRHEESGAIGRASDSRSQHDNRVSAFKRLAADPRMKFWIARRIHELRQGESLEQEIEKETSSEKLRYEVKNDQGQWQEVSSDYFNSEAAREVAIVG